MFAKYKPTTGYGYNWRGFDAPEHDDPPSEWVTGDFDELVFDMIDKKFYQGDLKGLDAGDVMEICQQIQNEINAFEV